MKHSIVAALVLLAASSLSAQARLTGTVRDTTGAPLAGVEISVQGTTRTTMTDRNGAFQLSGIPSGTASVTVRRVGFQVQTTIMKFVDGDNAFGEVVLTRLPRELDTVTTREQELFRQYPLLREFEENRKVGLGQFVTRQVLETHRGGFMTPVFNQMRGVLIVRSANSGSRAWVANTQSPTTHCTTLEDRLAGEPITPTRDADCQYCFPSVYLDRHLLNKPGEAANIGRFHPDMLQAIEVYLGGAETPVAYTNSGSGCGVIVFHTRVPDIKPRTFAAKQDHPTRSRVLVNASISAAKSGADCGECGSGAATDFRLGYTFRDRWVISARVANWSGNPEGFQSIKLRQGLLEWYPHPDPGRFKWFLNTGVGSMSVDLFKAEGVEKTDHYKGGGLPAMVLGTGVDVTLVQRFVVTPFWSYNRNLGGRVNHTHCVYHLPNGSTTFVASCNTVPSQPKTFTLLQLGARIGWR